MESTPQSTPRRLAIVDGQATVELLSRIVDAVPTGVVVVNDRGTVSMANSAVFDLFGWEPHELLGRSVETLIPSSAGPAHERHRAVFARDPSTRPMGEGRLLRARRRDGSTFVVEVGLSPFTIDGALHVLAIVRDITSRIDAEAMARARAVSDDRMRIARDLHDGVIQDLFAAGLTLANLAGRLDPDDADVVENVVGMLDDAIHRSRRAVFQLHGRHGDDDLDAIVGDSERVFGFRPQLRIDGSTDHLPPSLKADLAGVVREALANAARHARASRVAVEVSVGDDDVVVRVTDDGVGMSPDAEARGSGLRSMGERARRRGGTVMFSPTAGGGTTVEWRSPIGTATT